jgi:hypothetical protein
VKKVDLSVEFVDENNNIVFAVLFIGVMTRRNMYAKRVSVIDSRPDEDYIKVNKKDVILNQNVTSVYDHLGITHYSISVPDEVGLDDPRIISVSNRDHIITEVDNFVAKCH